MTAIADYTLALQNQSDWIPYLIRESRLPGPRANLELAYATARCACLTQTLALLEFDSPTYLDQSPETFPVLCGWIAIGKFAGESPAIRARLRKAASDPRWRVREAVAMGLQTWGRLDFDSLYTELTGWAEGNPCEQRAAAAGLCEPDLLNTIEHASIVLVLLDRITAVHAERVQPKADGGDVLKKGLSYCWSVAVAANPDKGKRLMEKWMIHPSMEILRIMRENLSKKRLEKMDAAWVIRWRAILA